MKRAVVVGLASLLGTSAGCILEDNPDFSAGGTESDGSGTTFTTTASGPGTETSSTSMSGTSMTTTGATETGETETSETGGEEPPVTQGCDELDCPEIHVGFGQTDCVRMVDGVEVVACDYSGSFGVRAALGEAELLGGARVFLYDQQGIPASFVGGLNVPGHTSVLAAPGVPHDHIQFVWDGDPTGVAGNVRLRGDDIHLKGFTTVNPSYGQYGLTFWRVDEEEGTETAGHLIENLEVIAITPEDVGANSTTRFMTRVGQDTIVRNCRIWGYWEDTTNLLVADGFRFHHNTVAFYQTAASELFDAAAANDIEISNNVFLSLTNDMGALVLGNATTQNLTVVGNVVEGAGAVVVGAQLGAPDVMVENNTLGEAPLEAPHFPRFLSDATLAADPAGTVGGTSLDGVVLSEAGDVLPGALQNRSTIAGPRRTTITVGSGQCGGVTCDVDVIEESATQTAIWSLWPGGVLALYPAEHAGGFISWPIDVQGMGATPGDVSVVTNEQGFLSQFGFYRGWEAVVQVSHQLSDNVEISNLTIEARADQVGLKIEGSTDSAPPTPHIVERVIVVDRGDTSTALVEAGFVLGHNVILHDALVNGAFETCVRHGAKSGSSSETPATTNWVYNLTCRQTQPAVNPEYYEQLAVFDVASVVGSEWFNVAVETAEPAPLFRAQRRVSSTNSNLDVGAVALDPPTSYTATAWVVRTRSADYDGYTDAEGTYVLTDVDDVAAMDPFFVSLADSHLEMGSAGIDSGVDPTSIISTLPIGTDLDGTDRTGRMFDRGAYEQGL
jgi:hypothetical protein